MAVMGHAQIGRDKGHSARLNGVDHCRKRSEDGCTAERRIEQAVEWYCTRLSQPFDPRCICRRCLGSAILPKGKAAIAILDVSIGRHVMCYNLRSEGAASGEVQTELRPCADGW